MSRILLIAVALAWSQSCGGNTPSPMPTPVVLPPVPIVVDAGRPKPPPPVPVDSYEAACANEKALGCPEGSSPVCAASMRHSFEGHITTVPVACIVAARSIATLRACGFVKCIP